MSARGKQIILAVVLMGVASPVIAQLAPKDDFPALPPARACTPQDTKGIWKLVQVYEQPIGAIAQNFTSYPHQYIQFFKNSGYGKYESSSAEASDVIRNELQKVAADNQSQFITHKSGIIFFYKKSVSTSSVACFIITDPRDGFKKGQMLLMPPAPADGKPPGTKIVKIYESTSAEKPHRRNRKKPQ